MKKFTKESIYVFLMVALVVTSAMSYGVKNIDVSAAAISNLDTFNNVSDLMDEFNDDGAPEFTNLADSGINNTGSLNVPIGSNDIWTTKQGYSVAGDGDKYTFSAYFKIKANNGRGGLGFSSSDTNTANATYGAPEKGVGVTFHGGGGEFINNRGVTTLSWPPDLVLGDWYWMKFEVSAQGSDTYDLVFQIWETDVTGTIGSMKTEKTMNGVVNADLGGASTIHGYFSASGSRMEKIDDFKIELEGGATFVEEGTPVVISDLVSGVGDTTATSGGDITDDQGNPITARGVCWSTSEEPTTSDDCTADGTGTGTYTSSITGLTPGTTYYVRPYATNVEGTSYGPQESFMTTGTAPEPETDTDNDGNPDANEDAGFNSGDGNGDGTPDSAQQEVSAASNPVTGEYTTLETSGDCMIIQQTEFVSESSLAVQDPDADYPVGLADFQVVCTNPGDSTDVILYYAQEYDTSDWIYKKYDETGNEYADISSLVTYGVADVGGTMVTTASFTVTDGDPQTDGDGMADGVINDPGGPAVILEDEEEGEDEEEEDLSNSSCNSSIGNTIWNDMNKNGIQEMNELGLENVRVKLLDNKKRVVERTDTNHNGHYKFEDLCRGKYKVVVKEEDIQGFIQTYDPTGSEMNNKASVRLERSDHHTKADFGFTY